MQSSVRRDWFYPLAAALIFAAALLLVNPSVESGMNDDWSFIFTARQLASTGHLRYNGWSSPLIGFQAYWAALFIRIFGFSFFIVRASAWLVALLSIPLLWRVLRMVELTQAHSFAALLLFLLSPLVLPTAAAFMTDMPAFFLFAAALYCALKAWSAAKDSEALLWLAATALCGILSGSIRQIYWLTGICFLAVLAVTRLRSVRGRACALIGILVTLIFGAAASYWLAHQPYVPADDTLQVLRTVSRDDLTDASLNAVREFTGLALLCLPLTLPLAWTQVRRLPVWMQVLLLAAAIFIPYKLADPLPWVGNTLTNYGVIISGGVTFGEKPAILPDRLMLALAALGLASAAYALSHLLRHPPAGRFLALTAPFAILYSFVIVGRSPAQGLYDRYLIPLLFVVSALLLIAHAKQHRGIPTITWMLGAVFILYSLATTHDYFAEARARLKASDEVLQAGIPRTALLSGLEFDSWTQMERTGHVNNEKLKFPPNAYRQMDDCSGPDDTLEWWRSMEPDIAARYVVTLSPLAGLRESEFAPVEYWRWLPLGKYRVYVETLEKGSPPLTCKPDTELGLRQQ